MGDDPRRSDDPLAFLSQPGDLVRRFVLAEILAPPRSALRARRARGGLRPLAPRLRWTSFSRSS